MAKKRKFCAYRRLERAFTRKSKYRKKDFIRGNPNCKIVRHVMGEREKIFPYYVSLVAKQGLQIRDNALESARMTVNRHIEKKLGKVGYEFKIRVYPHHYLRENPLASGAGADRMSTGMKMSFGKTIGIAAQIRKGQVIFQIGVNEENIGLAKGAYKKAMCKFPGSYSIVVQSGEEALQKHSVPRNPTAGKTDAPKKKAKVKTDADTEAKAAPAKVETKTEVKEAQPEVKETPAETAPAQA